jgi:hypothetical protein
MGKIVVTCLGQYVYIKRKKTYSHEKELKTNKRNQHKRNNIDRQNGKGILKCWKTNTTSQNKTGVKPVAVVIRLSAFALHS